MRIFLPMLFLYGLIAAAGILVLTRGIPWHDPRVTKVGVRTLVYPAILLTLLLLGFAGASRAIDLGSPSIVFCLPLGVVFCGVALLKLALVMMKDVRRVLSKTEIHHED